jgi:hypothetical protein
MFSQPNPMAKRGSIAPQGVSESHADESQMPAGPRAITPCTIGAVANIAPACGFARTFPRRKSPNRSVLFLLTLRSSGMPGKGCATGPRLAKVETKAS